MIHTLVSPSPEATIRPGSALLWALALVVGISGPSFSQSYPPGFNDTQVVANLNVPTTFAFVPDGRMVIAEQSGAIRIFEDGILLPQPAIVLPVEVFDEQGLLGLAVDPDFPTPPHIYVFYTRFSGNQTGNVNRVSRLTLGGSTIDPASEVILLDNIPAGLGFHLAGCLRFGADDNLYISTGDTGWSTPYPQDLSLLQGKVLRIGKDGSIPADNPFVNTPGARDEIYQWGLRNPFRFSVQPGTSNLFIGDVGFENWEEVNFAPAGANFGWPNCEGNCGTPGYTNPIYQYSHSLGSAAIVGNTFYEGSNFPAEFSGNYFFFDHSRGHLGRMVLNASNQIVSVTMPFIVTASQGWLSGPVDLVLGLDGALYYCTYFPGTIRKIFYTGTGNRNPTAAAAATPFSGYLPLLVQFSSAGSFDVDGNPITYDWNFGDGSGHSSAANPSHSYAANGVYQATLTVSDGLGGFDTAPPVTITVGNSAPALNIAAPAPGSVFSPNDVIFFSGSGFDVEEGSLPANELHWRVNLHHLNHIHPVIVDHVGASGSFSATDHGENLADVFYRVYLWAEDATGLRNETSRDVMPDLSGPTPVTKTFTVAADNRDALSVQSVVRISGYSGVEPYDYVGNDAEAESAAFEFLCDIPDGATILEAYLTVVASPFGTPSPTGGMSVRFYNVLNAQPFVNGAAEDLANHHPLHPLAVSWPQTTAWVGGTDVVSPDIGFLVQLWINRADYAPNNHLGLVVTKGTIALNAYYGWADFAAIENPPRLTVRYVMPGATSAPPAVASSIVLAPARPNPFRDVTELTFTTPRPGPIDLSIYDLAGRRVRSLVREWRNAGTHAASWDGSTEAGRAAAGVYFVRLETVDGARTERLVRLGASAP